MFNAYTSQHSRVRSQAKSNTDSLTHAVITLEVDGSVSDDEETGKCCNKILGALLTIKKVQLSRATHQVSRG